MRRGERQKGGINRVRKEIKKTGNCPWRELKARKKGEKMTGEGNIGKQ